MRGLSLKSPESEISAVAERSAEVYPTLLDGRAGRSCV